jgi:hypothetical protein
MNPFGTSTASEDEQPRRQTTGRRSVALASLLLGLIAVAGCSGPALNSPEGLEQEQDMREEEEENRRSG